MLRIPRASTSAVAFTSPGVTKRVLDELQVINSSKKMKSHQNNKAMYEAHWLTFKALKEKPAVCSQSLVERYLELFDIRALEVMPTMHCQHFLKAKGMGLSSYTVDDALKTMKARVDPEVRDAINEIVTSIPKSTPEDFVGALIEALKQKKLLRTLDWYQIRKVLRTVSDPIDVPPRFLQDLVGIAKANIDASDIQKIRNKVVAFEGMPREVMCRTYLVLTDPEVIKMNLDKYSLLKALRTPDFPIAGQTLDMVITVTKTEIEDSTKTQFNTDWKALSWMDNLNDRILSTLCRCSHLPVRTWQVLWALVIMQNEYLSPAPVKLALKIFKKKPTLEQTTYINQQLKKCVVAHDGRLSASDFILHFLLDVDRPADLTPEQLFNGLAARKVAFPYSRIRDNMVLAGAHRLGTPCNEQKAEDEIDGPLGGELTINSGKNLAAFSFIHQPQSPSDLSEDEPVNLGAITEQDFVLEIFTQYMDNTDL